VERGRGLGRRAAGAAEPQHRVPPLAPQAGPQAKQLRGCLTRLNIIRHRALTKRAVSPRGPSGPFQLHIHMAKQRQSKDLGLRALSSKQTNHQEQTSSDAHDLLRAATSLVDLLRRRDELAEIESAHDYIQEVFSKRTKAKSHERRDRRFDTDVIVHTSTFQPTGKTGGTCAHSVLSDAGNEHCARRYQDLTELELQVEGLIHTLHDLRDVPGRMTIYATTQSLIFHLGFGIRAWRQTGKDNPGNLPGDQAWWSLLFRLFDERQAAITYVEPGSSPAVRYCERVAKLCHESGQPFAPDRWQVLRSLASD